MLTDDWPTIGRVHQCRTGRLVTREFAGVALVCVVSAATAACHAGGQPTSAATGVVTPAPAAHHSQPIDACSMLSPQDISALLGSAVPGTSTGRNPDMGDCTWENPSTLESVSVEIGNSGTARDDVLPAPEPGVPDVSTPGPEGMRYMGGGSVEFAAGTRINSVQVAVLRLSGDQANSAAVQLARKIIPEVPTWSVHVVAEARPRIS